MSGDMPQLEQLRDLDAPQTSDTDGNSDAISSRKEELSNRILEGKIARDRQRQRHRSIIFWFGVMVCLVFYMLFLFIMIRLFAFQSDLLTLLPSAWIFPLLGLLTVPTIFLIVLVMSIYRERPDFRAESGLLPFLKHLLNAFS